MCETERKAAGGGRIASIEAASAEFYLGPSAERIVEFISSNPVEDATGEAHAGLLDYDDMDPRRLRLGHNTADYLHTWVEAAKLSFADREAYDGDPLFDDVPLDMLLSEHYAEQRRTRPIRVRPIGSSPKVTSASSPLCPTRSTSTRTTSPNSGGTSTSSSCTTSASRRTREQGHWRSAPTTRPRSTAASSCSCRRAAVRHRLHGHRLRAGQHHHA